MGNGVSVPDGYTPTIANASAPIAQQVCPGYIARNVRPGLHGLAATLSLGGPACNAYGTDIDSLELTVEYQDAHRLAVNIQPTHMDSSNTSHYVLDPDFVEKPKGSILPMLTDMRFDWGNTPSFWFAVSRRSSREVLFSTKNTKLVYENQFLEFATTLPENYNISGLGEHIYGLRLQPGLVVTNWNADKADPVDFNMYGTQPFYLETRYTQKIHGAGWQSSSHGVYLRNSHGLEAVLGDRNLTWRALGGAVELYFMDGPSPADVTMQYTSGAVGLPAMQQYWTFGFHQCHWGYTGWDEVQNSIDQYRKLDVPLEVQWVDIDYMNSTRDFTLDSVKFPEEAGKALIDKLHADGQYFVPIFDAGLWYPGEEGTNPTYDRGHQLDVFVKNADGTEFVGQAWPGPVVWPDWVNPKAEDFFANEIVQFHKTLAFDGIWIDLNEPSNFCTGSCGTKTPQAGTLAPGERDINYPPYAINNVQGFLSQSTIATNATLYGGLQHYDVHNIYGHGVLKSVNTGLRQTLPGKRPFIIGRSTFSGTGKYSGHWGGDNFASWQLMYWSIPQALTNALFGIPMFGADTCGISGDTTEELCGRWMQLSAFFPFYRNHYAPEVVPHEAWRWPDVAEWSRDVMKIRYALLPYLYTLFHSASTTGSTVMRALSWEFQNDPTLFGADRQFLLGPAIMVIPVLNEGAGMVDGVFPGDQPWYDWYNQTAVPKSWHERNTTLSAPQGHIPVFVRGGYVLPMQAPGYTTSESRKNPWSVLVALDGNGNARGNLYSDDGESLVPPQQQFVDFTAGRSSLSAVVRGDYDGNSGLPLANVTVMGVQGFRGRVRFNDRTLSSRDVSYDNETKVLKVTGLSGQTSRGAWDRSWQLSWH